MWCIGVLYLRDPLVLSFRVATLFVPMRLMLPTVLVKKLNFGQCFCTKPIEAVMPPWRLCACNSFKQTLFQLC